MPPDTLSFHRRAQLTELMDEPCPYEEFRDCLRDLEQVNRTVLAYRPTLHWLRQFATSATEPLHILDVGSGGGDMLRRIERWARHSHTPVRLTGLDLNSHAARSAREFAPPSSQIEFLTSDVFSFAPPASVDIVLSSLFTHHLSDGQIVRFLQWMERTAQRGWFINDLERSSRSYRLFKLLARMRGWHPFVVHDGPVSIQRSFSREDWRSFVRQAGLALLPIEIVPAWPGRLCVARVKR